MNGWQQHGERTNQLALVSPSLGPAGTRRLVVHAEEVIIVVVNVAVGVAGGVGRCEGSQYENRFAHGEM